MKESRVIAIFKEEPSPRYLRAAKENIRQILTSSDEVTLKKVPSDLKENFVKKRPVLERKICLEYHVMKEGDSEEISDIIGKIKDSEKFRATDIYLDNIQHDIGTYELDKKSKGLIYTFEAKKCGDSDLLYELINHCIVKSKLDSEDLRRVPQQTHTYAYLPLTNIFYKSTGAFLTSPTAIQPHAWVDELKNLLEERRNEDGRFLVTIISGTHGTNSSLQSAFTNWRLKSEEDLKNALDVKEQLKKSYDDIAEFQVINILDYNITHCPIRYGPGTSTTRGSGWMWEYRYQKKQLINKIKGSSILVLAWCFRY